MKVCEACGSEEVSCRDGENMCKECEERKDHQKKQRARKARLSRKARENELRGLGLTKVRGALGGVYWE